MTSDWIFRSQAMMYPIVNQAAQAFAGSVGQATGQISQNVHMAMQSMSEQHYKAQSLQQQMLRHSEIQKATEHSQALQANNLVLQRQKYDLDRYMSVEKVRSKRYGIKVKDKKNNYYAYLNYDDKMKEFESEEEMETDWKNAFPERHQANRKLDIQEKRATDLDEYRDESLKQKESDRDYRMWKGIEQARQFDDKLTQDKLVDDARIEYLRSGGAPARFADALGKSLKQAKGVEDLESKFIGNEGDLRASRDKRVDALIGKAGSEERKKWDDLGYMTSTVDDAGKVKRIPAISAAERKRIKAQIAEIDAELEVELARIKGAKKGSRGKFAPIK